MSCLVRMHFGGNRRAVYHSLVSGVDKDKHVDIHQALDRSLLRVFMERHEALAQTVEILAGMQRSNDQLLQEILRRLGALEEE